MTRYNLESSLADRVSYDQMVERYAMEMLGALSLDEALVVFPGEYTKVAWEQFSDGIVDGAIAVDSREEARARFFSGFRDAVEGWQVGQQEDRLYDLAYLESTGFQTSLVVSPAGQKDGLDYGPAIVEVVILDDNGKAIAYRYSDDSIDADWEMGSAENVVDAWLDARRAFEEDRNE